MKWLREISTQYIPGVEFDGENINFQNNNISWDEDYFTILPLTDGELSIKAYSKGVAVTGTTYSPSDNIIVYWRLKDSDLTSPWTSLSFSKDINSLPGYVMRTVTLTAGVPVELKCSTGISRAVTNKFGSGTIYPGSISTNCPAIIMGQLESLAVGDVSTSGTPGDLINDPGHTVPWVNYLDGLKELFKGWTTLIDASNLRMPDQFNSASVNPDFTGLFSGCSSLIPATIINSAGAIYTRFFEDCVSLRSVYANLSPSDRVEYTLTDWLKGTHAGDRTIYVPDTLDVNYDLYLPESWTREVYEF